MTQIVCSYFVAWHVHLQVSSKCSFR